MAFNNGQVSNGAAVIDSLLPDVPGPKSDWTVTEWGKVDYLNPADMTTNNSLFADPDNGDPLYTWQAADGLTSLSVYSTNGATAAGAPYVYDLEESDGQLNGGGTNLFLSSNLDSASIVTFNHPVSYSLNAKLNQASVSGGSIALAQVFTGFIVTFNASGNSGYDPDLPTMSAFMQVAISGSGTPHSRYEVQHGDVITYTYTLPEDQFLPYQATPGGPTLLSYNLNEYLDDMIANDPSLPSQAHDLGLWNLDSMYIGLETESGTSLDPNQGQVSVGLQVSTIQVQTDASPSSRTAMSRGTPGTSSRISMDRTRTSCSATSRDCPGYPCRRPADWRATRAPRSRSTREPAIPRRSPSLASPHLGYTAAAPMSMASQAGFWT
jgi:hypothetical protein